MKISVITVCYNAVSTIEQTIESVINQSSLDQIEYIVIDGNSSDGTLDIIKKYENKISKFVSEPDSGIYNAMNKGINLATGDYIHFLNANDCYDDKDVIFEVIKAAEDSQSDFIIGDVILVSSNGRSVYRSNKNISAYTIFSNWIYHVALFKKRDLFAKYGLFDESYKIAADNNWIIPLLLDKNITKSYLAKPIARFKLDGISAKEDSKKQTIAELEIVLAKNFKGKNNFFRRILQDRAFNQYSSLLIQFLNQKIRKFGLKKIIINFLLKRESWKIIYHNRYPKRSRKKLFFIAHGYHKKTRSHQFMLNYLSESYEIDVYYDETWIGGVEVDFSVIDSDYDAVIFWQFIPEKKELRNINHKNIIFFPMCDATSGWKFKHWYKYKNTKIINFSNATYRKLKKSGFDTYYLKYFPEPKEFIYGNDNEVFFWQRLTDVNINTVEKILGNGDFKLHIHKVIDPMREFIQPTENQESKFQISYSKWFENKNDVYDLIKEKAIYIAPRFMEGIGMSFLEAMSMGKVVIANDQPTMNEYIVDGETGFLSDYNNPKEINIRNVRIIQENTYKYMQEGHKKWLIDRKEIFEIIDSKLKCEIKFYRKLYHFFHITFHTIRNNIRKKLNKASKT